MAQEKWYRKVVQEDVFDFIYWVYAIFDLCIDFDLC